MWKNTIIANLIISKLYTELKKYVIIATVIKEKDNNIIN